MSYTEIKKCGAIICEHIAYSERPILRATRDLPLQPEDSGWQFLCGAEGHQDSDAAVWLLEEVAALDLSLLPILDAEPGVSFDRSAIDQPWQATQYVNEDEFT
jgi:hypothetical protein